MLGNLIGGFITILVGTSLMPAVADAVYRSVNVPNGTTNWIPNSNVSGTSTTIVNLLTLFYALALISTGIAITTSGLKQAGVL